MNDETIRRKTGRSVGEWIGELGREGVSSSTHKEIADRIHREYGVDYWWAQEITVEIERAVGRRVEGRRQDGTFQVSVSKTIACDAGTLWRVLTSPRGASIILGAESSADSIAVGRSGELSDGGSYEVTTVRDGSHLRLRMVPPDTFGYSILQVGVVKVDNRKCRLTFQHERLRDAQSREESRIRWIGAAEALAGATEGEISS